MYNISISVSIIKMCVVWTVKDEGNDEIEVQKEKEKKCLELGRNIANREKLGLDVIRYKERFQEMCRDTFS